MSQIMGQAGVGAPGRSGEERASVRQTDRWKVSLRDVSQQHIWK